MSGRRAEVLANACRIMRPLRMGQKIRLLIADDSATQRRLLQRHAEADGRFAIVGSGASAGEALVLLRRCDPQVMTLDIDMPGMDGITFLRRLMTSRPMPVVMLSASTAAGSAAALEALRIGAVDCLEKGAAILCPDADSLAERLAAAAGAQISVTGARRHPMPSPPVPPAEGAADLCLIGASTGGVPALEEILMAWRVTARQPPSSSTCPPAMLSGLPNGLTGGRNRRSGLRPMATGFCRAGCCLRPGTA